METETLSAAPTRRASLDETTIVVITSLAHALCHLGELIFPSVMLAVMHEFELEKYQVTAMSLMGLILFGAGALPVGLWADRGDSTRILFIYFVAMAGSASAVALAGDVWVAVGALTVLGLALSIYHPTGLAMISLGVRAKGRAMGINGVAGSIGIALSPILGTWAASLGMWRLAYGVLAGLSALFAIVMLVVLRRRPAAETHARVAGAEQSDAPVQPPKEKSHAALAILFIVMMLAGFNYRCLVTALPTFLAGEDARHTELLRAGLLVSVILFAGAFGQLLGGTLADRVGSARVYIFLVAALIPLSAILGFTDGSALTVAVASILAVAQFALQPVENTLLAEYTTTGRRSVSYGTKFLLTFGVGAVGAQVVGTIWYEMGTLNPVFWIISASACVMAGLLLLFGRVVRGT